MSLKDQISYDRDSSELLKPTEPVHPIDIVNQVLTANSETVVDKADGADAVRTSIAALVRKLVLAEIANDPAKRGYAGAGTVEICDKFNVAYVETVKVDDGQGGTFDQKTLRPPRISIVLTQIPYAPNMIDAATMDEIRA